MLSRNNVYDTEPVIAALLGMLVGVGGGMMRDILLAEILMAPRADLYAIAALAAGARRAAGTSTGCQEAAERPGRAVTGLAARSALLGRLRRSATRRGTEDARRACAISPLCSIASPARGAIRLNVAAAGNISAPIGAAAAARRMCCWDAS